jgi:3-oxoadipate enol-lactonase
MKVVLLHALPLDERMWEPQLAALEEYEVETPNLYGLGGASLDLWAVALLRQIWDEFVVVGASMGGYLGLALLRAAPERMRGLVLAGSRADADSPERKQDRQAAIAQVEADGPGALWTKMRPLLTAAADDELEARLHAMALDRTSDELIAALRAIRDRPDSMEVLSGFESPVLVIGGTKDGLVPVDDAKAIAAAAKDGEAVVLEGAGHLPSLEQPDAFDERLVAFLERLR